MKHPCRPFAMLGALCAAILFLGTAGRGHAMSFNVGMGVSGGFMPSMGDDLNSFVQQYYLNSYRGVDTINRSKTGYDTKKIDRLGGLTGGIDAKVLVEDYFLIRLGCNYTQSIMGGKGTTINSTDSGATYHYLSCKYSMVIIDAPLTLGLSIPFWREVKISLSGGVAFAYGKYESSFKAPEAAVPYERKASFRGFGYPLVAILEGEFFINDRLAVCSKLSYYHGSTALLTDGTTSDTTGLGGKGATDYAKINFTGYRFTMGISFYMDPI